MPKKLRVPFTPEEARTLRAGESVLLSGTVYTARDAAHKRLCELLSEGKELPLDIRNATIYYVGPTPAREGRAIGSAGPTTSYRMDAYSPALIAAGETGMIGKGKRGKEVIAAMKEHGAVYFGGIYMGCRTRCTAVGLETEVLDMPAALFERIRQAEAGLAALK